MSPQEAARLVGHELGERVEPAATGPDRRAWIAPGMGIAAAACLLMAWAVDAKGAEAQPYQIVIFERPMAAENPDRQRIHVISEAYPTKDACLHVLQSIKIRAPQAVARCLPKE